MLRTLPLLLTLFFITACTSNEKSTQLATTSDDMTSEQRETLIISKKNLQHHRWVLVKVDGKPINVPENFQAPTLEIGEKMTVNGHSGCNNFFGQGQLKNEQFRVSQMGMTRKMCPERIMEYELAYSVALGQWSKITLTREELELKSTIITLTFELEDWVN